MKRKIRDLLTLDDAIYILLPSKEIAEQFVKDAEAEGITFGDGVLPSQRSAGDVYRLYQNGTIAFVGYVGRVRLANDPAIHRINYEAYIRGVEDGRSDATADKKLFSGTSTILVYSKSLKDFYASAFYAYLKEEGFVSWGRHGDYGCGWIYINITDKIYAPGMPGIQLTTPLGDHAVTIGEFKTIYGIYRKYRGKEVFVFDKDRFDTNE